MNKNVLRKEMKEKRRTLDVKKRKELSKQVIAKLIASNDYKNSKNIFVFVSFGTELFTHDFIKNSISSGKNIYIPFIDEEKNIMYASKLNSFDDLELGYYNILAQPVEKINIVDPKLLDLVLVPGLIFGENFYRIGYGGGYYDKFLSQESVTAKKIGICFDFQLVEHVDFEPHDVSLDEIITDVRTIERK